jgi:hypothetical protein
LSALPSFCYAQVRESGTGEPGPVKSQHLTAELISDLGTIAPATHVLPELLTRGVVLKCDPASWDTAGQSDPDFNTYWKDRRLKMIRKAATTDISNIIQFVLEIDKLKGVLRKVRPIWEERYENTAEHSWQIALFAMSMARTLELKVDVTHVVAMLLVHDLGEIDAGDRFVFAQGAGKNGKPQSLGLWNASVD